MFGVPQAFEVGLGEADVAVAQRACVDPVVVDAQAQPRRRLALAEATGSSSKLANAYGVAVMGTMLTTTLLKLRAGLADWPRPGLETAIQTLTIGAMLWIVFGLDSTDEFKFFYLILLPVVAFSVKDGYVAAAFSVLASDLLMMAILYWRDTGTASVTELQFLMLALSRRLPGMIRDALAAQEARPALPVTGRFSATRQRALVVEVMKAMGFPFDRGRLDESEHPFTEGVPGDIRVTTRFDQAEPFTGLLGALHETGHAMYDLGMPAEWRDQPVGRDRGMALEESQSLLLEMIVGRSLAFTRYLQPLFLRHFQASGPEWEVDNLHRLLTRVRRGLIRVDADEMTYPLHIMQRYDLEKKLLAGTLVARDLPAAWDAAMEQRFGARPANFSEGCLQDVHWALGLFGYFPCYMLGSVIAAQLWESLRAQVDDVEAQIARGEFGGVFAWLRDHVHGYGAKLQVKELVREATGQPLGAKALLRYLGGKYAAETP